MSESLPEIPVPAPSPSLWTAQFVVAIYVLTILLVTILLVFWKSPSSTQDNIAVLVIGGIVGGVMGFFFGSSTGSQAKDILIAEKLPPKEPTT